MVLLVLLVITLFVADLAQNKFIDNGLNYQVIVFSPSSTTNWTMLAMDLWIYAMFATTALLMALFLNSMRGKSTDAIYDVIVAIFAFFGLMIMMTGVYAQLYTDSIYFFYSMYKPINFYHMGVYIEILASLYWAFTK